MNTKVKQEIIATLLQAKRSDLANVIAEVKVTAKGNIEDDTPIMPWIVSDSVIDEVMGFFYDRLAYPDKVKPEDKELEKEINKLYDSRRQLGDQLTDLANKIYKSNLKFKKQIKAPGNKGRDQLYVWVRHWVAAELKKHYPVIFKQLPSEFSLGHPIPKVRHASASTKTEVRAAEWLPNLLTSEEKAKVRSLVSQVSKTLKWDVFSAGAFTVALLEDVNAHDEAKAVNTLLEKMMLTE